METCHVLSGLSTKSGLHLLSPASSSSTSASFPNGAHSTPASNPVRSSSTSTSFPNGAHATSNERKVEHAGLSTCAVQPTGPSDVADPFSNITSPADNKPFTENEKPGGVICYDNPPSTISAVTMSVSFSEGNGNNDAFGIDEESDRVMCYEKPSSTMSSSSAISPVREDASLSEENRSSMKLGDVEDGLNEDPDRVTYQEKPCSGISPTPDASLQGEEDSLDDEPDGVTTHEKSSAAISPYGEDAISPQEEGRAIKLADDEDHLDEAADGVMCHEKPCSAIYPAGDDANLAEKEGSIMNLINGEDGLDEKPGHVSCQENSFSTTSAAVLVDGEDGELHNVTCHAKQSSTLETGVTDARLPREKKKKKTKKKSKKNKETITTSDVTSSCTLQNGATINLPFQTWIQNFTTYCKKQNEIEQKQTESDMSSSHDSNSQEAPNNHMRKQGFPEDYMSGNLESDETCPGVQSAMETACVETNMSEFTCEDASGLEHIRTSDHEENEFEYDFLNSAEAVPYGNVFEMMEDKGKEIDENVIESRENKDMEIDIDDSCARKRSLSIDNSGDVEKSSVEKMKDESKAKCLKRTETEGSFDSNWDKSDDLPLMANVDEVLVHHYILDLSVKFSEKIMQGNIVLFLEPRNEDVTKRQFQMTLDSTLVNIESVSEVVLPEDFQVAFCGHKQNGHLTQETTSSGVQNGFLGNILGDKTHTPLPFKGLSYSVYGWCVQIWKPDATGKAWPKCVWIKYHTSPEGTSLTWATDQDGK